VKKLNSTTAYLIVFLLALFPFFYIGFFSRPQTDDFGYYTGFFEANRLDYLIHHYYTWTGRYFATFLIGYSPYAFGNKAAYPFIGLTLFLSYIFVLKYLFQTLLSSFFKSWQIWLITLGVFALYLHRMPRVSDALYWLAGSLTYSVAPLLGLLFWAIHLRYRHFVTGILLVFMCAVIAGSNEVFMLQWFFFMSWCTLFFWWLEKKWSWTFALSSVTAFLGALVVFLSPGNDARADELANDSQHVLWLTLIKPLGLCIEVTARYLSFSALLLLIIAIPHFRKIQPRIPSWFFSKGARIWMLLLMGGSFYLTFVPGVWVMGGLPPKRALDICYFFMIFLSAIVIFQSLETEGWPDRVFRWFETRSCTHYLTIGLALSFIFTFNNFNAWKDVFIVNAYAQEFDSREKFLTQHPGEAVSVDPILHRPSNLLREEISTDPQNDLNKAYAHYCGVKSVRLNR
jgi:hypothetical protein